MTFNRESVSKTERIAGGLRRHDPDAVACLYDWLGARLYSVILGIVRNPITAEDLVQDTFMTVWNSSDQFSGDSETLSRWLFTIGRHKAIDHIRAKRRRPENHAINLDGDNHSLGSLAALRRQPDGGEAHDVREAIGHLSAKHREVIRLAYYEGLSQTEIASRLAQPLGTVKAWTRVALKHLRESINPTPAAVTAHSGIETSGVRKCCESDGANHEM